MITYKCEKPPCCLIDCAFGWTDHSINITWQDGDWYHSTRAVKSSTNRAYEHQQQPSRCTLWGSWFLQAVRAQWVRWLCPRVDSIMPFQPRDITSLSHHLCIPPSKLLWLEAAKDNDVIQLSGHVFNETVSISKSLTLEGVAGKTVIQSLSSNSCVVILNLSTWL